MFLLKVQKSPSLSEVCFCLKNLLQKEMRRTDGTTVAEEGHFTAAKMHAQ